MTEHEEAAKPTRRKLGRVSALAVLAGILVGTVAVYVKERPSGNDAKQAAANAACARRTEKAKALDKAAVGEVAAMRAAHPPFSVASLTFDGPDGKPMTLAKLRGRTLLVNLWASWCAPCREEMPTLDRLQTQMGGGDFQVVAIDVDTGDPSRSERFLKEVGAMSLPRYRDATMGVFDALKRKGLAYGLPVTMLVDKDGCDLATMNGPADWASRDAKHFIDVALESES